MEEIFSDSVIRAEDIKKAFGVLFPKLKLFQWFPWEGDVDPIGFNRNEPTHILFDIYEENKRIEFKWRLSCYGPPNGYTERERLLANYLSEKMQTRTLVSYQLPSEPHDPFYNLIYDKGICYLADDSLFSWTGEAGEPSEPIKIVRLIELPDATFDGFGRPIK